MLHVCVFVDILKTQSVKPGQWRRAWKKQTNWKPHRRQHYFLPLGACFSCVTDSDVTGSATTCRQTTKSEERRYRINIRFISAAAFKHSRRQNITKQNKTGGGESWKTFYKRTAKGKCLMSAAREVLSQQGGRQLTAAVKGTCLQSIRQTPPP